MEIILLVLNYLLAWYSARTVAQSWLDARAAGRWAVALCWIGALLAASGFTWCYLTVVLVAAHSFGLVVSSSVRLVTDAGGLLLASLALGVAFLIPAYCRLQSIRARLLRGDRAAWDRFYGAAVRAVVRVTGRDGEEQDSDLGTVVVLFGLLAVTAMLGFVQPYLMIRAGIRETARQMAQDYRHLLRAVEIEGA